MLAPKVIGNYNGIQHSLCGLINHFIGFQVEIHNFIVYSHINLRIADHIHQRGLHAECGACILEMCAPYLCKGGASFRRHCTAALYFLRINILSWVRPVEKIQIRYLLRSFKTAVGRQGPVVRIYIRAISIPVECGCYAGGIAGIIRNVKSIHIIACFDLQFVPVGYAEIPAEDIHFLSDWRTHPYGWSV